MAYQTGNAKSMSDLMSKLLEFAQPLGWVVDYSSDNRWHIHNDDGHYEFAFNTNRENGTLWHYATTGYDAGQNSDNQPGSCTNHSHEKIYPRTNAIHENEIVTYDFFGTAQYLHVAIQLSDARFRHFGVGTLDKEGDYLGGQYAFGTYILRWNKSHYGYETFGKDNLGFCQDRYSCVRADFIGGDTRTPYYWTCNSEHRIKSRPKSEFGKYVQGLGLSGGVYQVKHPDDWLVALSQSNFGNRLIPVPHSLIAQGVDGLFYRLGTIPDRYCCTMRGIFPRQILEIDGERWMIVPAKRFESTNAQYSPDKKETSGVIGVAYRLVEDR